MFCTILSWHYLVVLLSDFQSNVSWNHLKVPLNSIDWRSYKHCFKNKLTFQKFKVFFYIFTPFLTVWILLSPFSFDLCFSSLSSFHYRSRSLCSSVIILWQISFDHRKSKERCITILAPLPILNDDHLCSSTYYQLKSISNYRWVLEKMINITWARVNQN